MLYDYSCESCNYQMVDVYQSINDQALTQCPQCGENSLNRIIYGGAYACVKQEPTTIGQQSERNWSKKGHYEKSAIEAQADKQAKDKRESRKMINRLNKDKQYHYIMTGEVKK